jgi:hypothetical protein
MKSTYAGSRTFYTDSNPTQTTALHETVASASTASTPSHAPVPFLLMPKAVTVRTMTLTSVGVLSPNPILGIIRPVGPGWPPRLALPRSRFALPTLISPVPIPNSATLFEEPQDGTKKHYLQQYAIAIQGSPEQPLYGVSLSPTAPNFTLTVNLSAVPLDGVTAGATPVTPTSVSYLLSATLLGRVVTWDFSATQSSGDALTLVASVTGKAARDTLYHAMTDPTAGAQLIIRSAVPIASPVSAAPSYPPQPPNYRMGPTTIDQSVPYTF